jgi:hypothetical protein
MATSPGLAPSPVSSDAGALLTARPAGARPIVVAGIPRSGTSWFGRVLESGGDVVYINEPLNTNVPPGHRPGLLHANVPHRFQYVCAENEDEYLAAFRDMFALRFHPLAELKANHGLYGVLRMLKYWSDFERGRLTRRRPLMDEPLACFSVEWLASRFGVQTVFLVRHPAAIAYSRKQLGHMADFSNLLRQRLLVKRFLVPFEAELEEAQRRRDLIENACLLWRIVYSALVQLREHVADLYVVRHEDLSNEPLREFERAHSWLGVPFAERTRRFVAASTSARSDKKGATLEQRRKRAHSWSISRHGISKTGFRPLDSKAYAARWKRGLTREEIARIRYATEDVAVHFYSAEDWA